MRTPERPLDPPEPAEPLECQDCGERLRTEDDAEVFLGETYCPDCALVLAAREAASPSSFSRRERGDQLEILDTLEALAARQAAALRAQLRRARGTP